MQRAATISLLATWLATLLSGCAAIGHQHGAMAPRTLGGPGLHPHLLFDRVAGVTDATDLVARDSWPVAPAGRLVEEEIRYQESFRDRQSGGRHSNDDFQRRFTTYRRGRIRR